MVFGGLTNTNWRDEIIWQQRKIEYMKKIQTKQENIFKEFEEKTILRLKKEESIVGNIRQAELELFGKRLLENISGKEITDVTFGCGCDNRDYRLAGNFNNETGVYEISSKRYETLEDIYLQYSPEVIILNMFANKSGFGCQAQENYPKMYVDFINRKNMDKYPEFYRALANSDQSRVFQRFYRFEDGTPVTDSRGYGYYEGTTMRYSIKDAVRDKIGL